MTKLSLKVCEIVTLPQLKREPFPTSTNIMPYYTIFSLEEWSLRALTDRNRDFSLCLLVQVCELFLNNIPDYSFQTPAYNTAFPKQSGITNT